MTWVVLDMVSEIASFVGPVVRLSGGKESAAGCPGQPPGGVNYCPEALGHSAQCQRKVEVAGLEGP